MRGSYPFCSLFISRYFLMYVLIERFLFPPPLLALISACSSFIIAFVGNLEWSARYYSISPTDSRIPSLALKLLESMLIANILFIYS